MHVDLHQFELGLGLLQLRGRVLLFRDHFRGIDLGQQLPFLDHVTPVHLLRGNQTRDLGIHLLVFKRPNGAGLCGLPLHASQQGLDHLDGNGVRLFLFLAVLRAGLPVRRLSLGGENRQPTPVVTRASNATPIKTLPNRILGSIMNHPQIKEE